MHALTISFADRALTLRLPEEECEAVMAEWGSAWRDDRVLKLTDGGRRIAVPGRAIAAMAMEPIPDVAPIRDGDGRIVGEAVLDSPGIPMEGERCSAYRSLRWEGRRSSSRRSTRARTPTPS